MRKIESKEDEEINQIISQQFIEKSEYDKEKKKSWYDKKER